MAKDSNRLAGSFEQSGGGAFSGLLAEEEEFDRRALWRLGTWAAVSIGAVIIAILANQSTIGIRKELTASADFVRQAQQLQLAAKDNLAETRRLSAAIDTLNGDRDRLYSRVSVLEQGLDSVTGAIARQNSPAPATPAVSASTSPVASTAPVSATNPSAAPSSVPTVVAAPPSAPPSSTLASTPASTPASLPSTSAASVTPAAATVTDPSPATSKPSVAAAGPAPAVAPVATAAVGADKPSPKPAPPEVQTAQPPPSNSSQPAPNQSAVSLVASKSMMGPPDPAAPKLIEAPALSKTATAMQAPDVPAPTSKTSGKEAGSELPAIGPELAVKRTEFGVDLGGANSIPGLRALWRGLLKSRANAALTALHPVIVIKENNNGLGMQLRLVAGPLSDAAAAAKICATLTVSDRSCSTAVFEGQRLAIDEPPKAEVPAAPETTSTAETKPASSGRGSSHRHYGVRRSTANEEPPKPEKPEQPSTMSLLFGRH